MLIYCFSCYNYHAILKWIQVTVAPRRCSYYISCMQLLYLYAIYWKVKTSGGVLKVMQVLDCCCFEICDISYTLLLDTYGFIQLHYYMHLAVPFKSHNPWEMIWKSVFQREEAHQKKNTSWFEIHLTSLHKELRLKYTLTTWEYKWHHYPELFVASEWQYNAHIVLWICGATCLSLVAFKVVVTF